MSVELYEEGGAVVIVKHRRTKKRKPGPSVELMAQLEAYARRVYRDELAAGDRKHAPRAPYSEEDKAMAIERLRSEAPSAVSRATGVSLNTLKRWALDAGVALIDGHKVPDPPAPRAGSGQRTYGARSKEAS